MAGIKIDKIMNKNIRSVLYVLEDVDSMQFRYRYENVKDVLDIDREWSLNYSLSCDVNRNILDSIDLVVIGRQTAKSGKILDFISSVKESEKKILFDLDDLVFDYNDLFLVSNTVGEKNLLYWLGYIWGIRRIAKKVDGFLTTNDFLGEKLKRSFNKPYKVIKNSLNQSQIKVSEKYVKNKIHDGFRIGYFSGSPTHVKDFKVVELDLIRFLNAHNNAVLRVVGDMNFSLEMKKLIKLGKVQVEGKVDYLKLQRLISEVDVNIAPLVINDFTNCKSELKFFEAAIVETTTIASPTYTFKNAITDGKNGFLAQPGEWYDKLEYLYKRPKENQKIAKAAKEYALKHYYGKEFLKEVEEAYGFFAK